MRIRDKIVLGRDLFGPVLFGVKRPVLVSWEVTQRCNLRCAYCDAGRGAAEELETACALNIVEELRRAGTRAIRFTGGEPLLRADLPLINDHAKRLGILTALSTNGSLFCERIKEIRRLNSVSFSLDGPEEIHDALRGPGSHKKVLEAIEEAKRRGIPVSVSATLNSLNLESVPYLLNDIAKKLRVKVFFQPATKTVLFGDRDDPVCPDVGRYREAVSFLMRAKKENPFIGNSGAGLGHLYHWPEKRAIPCVAGRLICRLDSRGRMTSCARFHAAGDRSSVAEEGVETCFARLRPPGCRECWCSFFVELNMISGFNLQSFMSAVKT